MFRAIVLSLSLLASNTLHAETVQTADNLIQVTAKRILTQIETDRERINTNPRHVYDLVNEILLPHIDFTRMSRWVLGKHWRRAKDEERQAFIEEFRKLIVRTYSTALLEYSGQEIRFLPIRDLTHPDQASVRTEVRPNSGPMIPISYDLYRNDAGKWKVYDVSIDGISLIANYRSNFGSQIRRTGSLNRVINQMRSRSQQAKK